MEFYADSDPELGLRFADELDRTLYLIESYPLAGRHTATFDGWSLVSSRTC